MSDTNERFRNEFASRIMKLLQPGQLKAVMEAFDYASASYTVTHKAVELTVYNGTPEIIKIYLASKAIQNLSKGTIKQYRYKLIDFFDTVKKTFQDISSTDIRLYLYQFKQKHNASDTYLECIRVTLHTFFEWLVINDYLLKNPCSQVEHIKFQSKQREPLTSIELETFRTFAESHREKAVIDFLFSTGCRVSECADVRMSDIDWNKRSVLIRHGKGNKSRTVYFNAESEVTLRRYLSSRSDSTDALFVSEKEPHQQLCSHSIESIISKVSERSGIHVYPHRLRHTFATSGLRGGMPLEKLQALMGHTKPETTMIYAKLNQTDLQMEHQRIYT